MVVWEDWHIKCEIEARLQRSDIKHGGVGRLAHQVCDRGTGTEIRQAARTGKHRQANTEIFIVILKEKEK